MLLLISRYDIMDEETIYEFGIAIVIILSIFNFLHPGADFIAIAVIIIALIGVFLFLKGLAQYVIGKEKENIWAGVILIMIVAVLFGGLSTVLDAFRLVLSVGLTAIDHGLSWMASVF